MALGSEDDGLNNSLSWSWETKVTRMMQRSTNFIKTLTSPSPHTPPLPTLPFDLVAEILCRLPVKLLLQLRCLCKSFDSLISDPKFAKKHLCMSTPHYNLMVSSTNNLRQFLLFVSPILSVFSTNSVTQRQLSYPNSLLKEYGAPLDVCSCDGIICFTINDSSALLWNPSINKFNMLPPLEITQKRRPFSKYSFGYDPFTNDYKVFVVSFCINKNKVSVHTLGTSYWRRIEDFPCCSSVCGSGIFIGGTINWLTFDNLKYVIVSLDLKSGSYQKLLQPDDSVKNLKTLGVLRDYLCIFASSEMCLDIWIMKEYGKKESWTKFYSVPYMENWGLYAYTKALYNSDEDQVLMDLHELGSIELKLGVYDFKNGISKIFEIQNSNYLMNPKVYIESLISPCF